MKGSSNQSQNLNLQAPVPKSGFTSQLEEWSEGAFDSLPPSELAAKQQALEAAARELDNPEVRNVALSIVLDVSATACCWATSQPSASSAY